MSSRRDELAANLAAVQERIGAACADAGRERGDVTLIVVTKTYPASDVAHLVDLGIREFGENRHPEAERKFAELAQLRPDTAVQLHFLGGVQTNKASAVARYADVIHSVDRPKLAASLDRSAAAAGRQLDVLVEVDFSGEAGRAGVEPSGVLELCDQVAKLQALNLRGLMTVAPLGHDPAPSFAELADLSQEVRRRFEHATWISAGMSGDLEQAIRAGATHLRIGRSVLGERLPVS